MGSDLPVNFWFVIVALLSIVGVIMMSKIYLIQEEKNKKLMKENKKLKQKLGM